MEEKKSFFKDYYQKWMDFAEKINTFVMTIVFSVIYFILLPVLIIFRKKDVLGLRANKNKQSFWVKRSQSTDTMEQMQRMG